MTCPRYRHRQVGARGSQGPHEGRLHGASEHQDGRGSAGRAVGGSLSEQGYGTRQEPGVFIFPFCDTGYRSDEVNYPA